MATASTVLEILTAVAARDSQGASTPATPAAALAVAVRHSLEHASRPVQHARLMGGHLQVCVRLVCGWLLACPAPGERMAAKLGHPRERNAEVQERCVNL